MAFQEFASIFVPQNGIRSCFLFRGIVPESLLLRYFSSTERNSDLFSLSGKGSEWNSESLLLFQFHGTEFRIVFSSAEGIRHKIFISDKLRTAVQPYSI
jgi:hypothetical protein